MQSLSAMAVKLLRSIRVTELAFGVGTLLTTAADVPYQASRAGRGRRRAQVLLTHITGLAFLPQT